MRNSHELSENTRTSGNKSRILLFIAVVVVTVVAGAVLYRNSDMVRLKRQLDLGQKYLLEMNYEGAVVAFDQAIAIDPRSADAYLGLADAYLGLGDEEAAYAALEAGYEATGDERLKARMDEMNAAAEEAADNEITDSEPVPVINSDEVIVRLDEIDEILDGDGRPYHLSSNGSTRLLTYEQIESAYRPLAEELELYLAYGQGDWTGTAWKYLAEIYLHLGEMEKCLKARRSGYEATGQQSIGLMPETYEYEDGTVIDEYGRPAGNRARGEVITYGQGDRYIEWKGSGAGDWNYEYDSFGRIKRAASATDEYIYEYQGDYSVAITWKYGNSIDLCTLNYDQYGDYGSHMDFAEVSN